MVTNKENLKSMFVIDEITIIIGIATLVVALISPLVNVLLIRLKTGEDKSNNGMTNVSGVSSNLIDVTSETMISDIHVKSPGICIVVTVDDEIEDLRANLPEWLQQDYAGEFQVIVVMTGNSENIENILKQSSGNSRLYTTFIPASSRYMSRRKLAITVGIKAAKYDWILLTDVDCRPCSRLWLQSMSKYCSESTDIVLGYTKMDVENKGDRIFDYTYLLYRQLSSAQRGNAWAVFGSNMLLRKETFIHGKGFDGNLKFLRGEYDFLLNKFSTPTNTSVAIDNDACIVENVLTDKAWRNKNLYFLSTINHLRGVALPKFFAGITILFMILANIVFIASMVYSAVEGKYILTIISAVALILSWTLRVVILSNTLKKWVPEISLFKMFWYEQTIPFRKIKRYINYKLTDKYDFITHKI